MSKKNLVYILGLFLCTSILVNIFQSTQIKQLRNEISFFEIYFNSSENRQQDKLTIYFQPDVKEPEIMALKQFTESQIGVMEVEYITAAQAIIDFKSRLGDDQVTLESLDKINTNPLGARLIIKLDNSTQKGQLADIIQKQDKNGLISSFK